MKRAPMTPWTSKRSPLEAKVERYRATKTKRRAANKRAKASRKANR